MSAKVQKFIIILLYHISISYLLTNCKLLKCKWYYELFDLLCE
nr:MAG TPA: hypothetical protein [Caudoviricetes sp.]